MDKHVARATALLAANGYALIRLLDFLEENRTPNWLLLSVLIPTSGLTAAYGLLEESGSARRKEQIATATVAIMLLLWGLWRLFP